MIEFRPIKALLFFVLAAFISLSAPGVYAQSLQIKDAFARATNPGQSVGGGYLTIENPNASPDKLIGVTFVKAETVQIHEMKMDGDKMMMRDIGSLPIPARSKVELKPGGYHLMFMGLKEQLKDGESATVVLQFEKAGKVEVKMPIKSMMNHSNHSNMHSGAH